VALTLKGPNEETLELTASGSTCVQVGASKPAGRDGK